MVSDNRLLMIGFGDDSGSTREQLLRLGFLPFEVGGLEEAANEFARGNSLSGTVLLSTTVPSQGLRPGLERLRAVAGRLVVIAIGPDPGSISFQALRSVGVTIGLWTPFEQEELETILSAANRPIV